MNKKLAHLLVLNVIFIVSQGNISVTDHDNADNALFTLKCEFKISLFFSSLIYLTFFTIYSIAIRKINMKNFQLINHKVNEILEDISLYSQRPLNPSQSSHSSSEPEELKLILKDNYYSEIDINSQND